MYRGLIFEICGIKSINVLPIEMPIGQITPVNLSYKIGDRENVYLNSQG